MNLAKITRFTIEAFGKKWYTFPEGFFYAERKNTNA